MQYVYVCIFIIVVGAPNIGDAYSSNIDEDGLYDTLPSSEVSSEHFLEVRGFVEVKYIDRFSCWKL